MKNSQSIRKILFITKVNIALVVFNQTNGENNILFANQESLNSANLKVVINDLLTSAANFLGFNIKEVEIIFDDPEIQTVNYKEEFYDCNDEDEITKAIYTRAKTKNHFVNEIVFNNVFYDDIEKKAVVDADIVANNYMTYKQYIVAAKECNLNILNSTNLWTLINNKNASSQIIIRMLNDQITIGEYALAKLNNVASFKLELDEIYNALADKFNLSIESVKQIINIINSLDSSAEDETMVHLNYDVVHRNFNSIKANEFIEAYQAELNYLIANNFNLNSYSEVTVVTNNAINRLANAKVEKANEIIGLESIDNDKLLALAKIDHNAKANSHFKFECSINSKFHLMNA